MRAVTVKYLPPTDFKGARLRCSAESVPSLTIPYPHELSGSDVFWHALRAYVERNPVALVSHGWRDYEINDLWSGCGIVPGTWAFVPARWAGCDVAERIKNLPAASAEVKP